jgi:hypothetical protein
MIPKRSEEKTSVAANPKRDEEVRIGSCCVI